MTEMKGDGFWFKSCFAKHEFISYPIEGWHGVKFGDIKIGPKQKPRVKPYKLWLQAVKDKWNSAGMRGAAVVEEDV